MGIPVSIGFLILLFSVADLRGTPIGLIKPSATITRVRPAPDFRAARPVVPFSIVPGGVRSPKEIEDSMIADPVARKLYANIRLRSLVVTRLTKAQDLYAAFRIGDEVHWTKRKLHIPAGELILTDGSNIIRARCGNLLASELPLPKPKEAPFEPPVIVFDIGIPPLFPGVVAIPAKPAPTSGVMIAKTEPAEPLSESMTAPPTPKVSTPPSDPPTYWPPMVVPPTYCCATPRHDVHTPPSEEPPNDNPPKDNPPSENPPTDNPPTDYPPDTPGQVPEPGTLVMLASGVSGIAAWKMKRG